MSKKIKSESVVNQIIDYITQEILDKNLKPGDRIPTEIELAEKLGVARNSIREAVKILIFMGVLEIRRPEGTFVCNGFSKSLIDPMLYGIILNQDDDSFDNLMEVRLMSEVGVMEICISKASDEDIDRLKEPLENLKSALLCDEPDLDTAFNCDEAFHDMVLEIGNNLIVSKINGIVRQLTYAMRKSSVEGMIRSGRAAELYEVHEELYNILKSRDASDLHSKIEKTYFVEESELTRSHRSYNTYKSEIENVTE